MSDSSSDSTNEQPTIRAASGSSALTPDDAFEALQAFFENGEAARQAIGGLKTGVEIAVSIGDAVDCALFQTGGRPKVEKRKAVKPDFSFTIRPETVYVLSKQPSDDVGEVGIAVLKEILAGNISVRLTGNILSVLSGGYLDVVKKGGAKFASHLAAHGLNGAGKIMAAIKSLRA